MILNEFIKETQKNQMISTLLKHYNVGNVKVKQKSMKDHAHFDVDRGTLELSTKYKVIKKNKVKELFDVLDGNELRADTLLMDSTMFNRLFLYDATTVGDPVGSEMHVNGYSYATLFGRKLVVSNTDTVLAIYALFQ